MLRKAGLLLMGILIAALAGCSANTTTAPTGSSSLTPDQAAVQTSIAAQAGVFDDGLSDASGTSAGFSAHGGATGPLEIVPEGVPSEPGPGSPPREDRRYWRVITGVDRSFDVTFSEPDSGGHPQFAHVVIHKHFTGTFHAQLRSIVPSSTGGDSAVVQQIVKPLKDHWVRNVWLARRPWAEAETDSRRGWRLIGASGIEVTSEIEDGGAQPHIVSIHVQSGEASATFTDPAAAIHWAELWRPTPGTAVDVTVTTDQPDDVVVLVHRDGRARLTPNGDNTYSGSWMPNGDRGLKHFGVDAMSHATVFDADAGYHANAWLFPFLHAGEVIAGGAE